MAALTQMITCRLSGGSSGCSTWSGRFKIADNNVASDDSNKFNIQPWHLSRWDRGHNLVTEFRGMTLNCLFCADMLWPLDFVPPH